MVRFGCENSKPIPRIEKSARNFNDASKSVEYSNDLAFVGHRSYAALALLAENS